MYLMCRLCFEDERNLENLFDIEKSLFSTINDCLFEIPDIDGWPTGICEVCKLKLVITTDFFKTCRKTHQLLLEQMRETISDENKTNEIDENPDVENKVSDDEDLEQLTPGEDSLLKELITKNYDAEIPTNRDNSVENSYKCSECDKTFTFKAGLVIHMRIHTGKTSENDKKFKCKFCERKFQFKGGLGVHMRSHFNKNAENLRKSSLAVHENNETYEEELDSSLESNEKVANDNVKNSDKNLFQCTDCERSFKAKSSLSNHMRRHFNENAENLRQSSLAVHENNKNSDKEELDSSLESNDTVKNPTKNLFQCTDCERSFKTKSSLSSHMRRHFNENAENLGEILLAEHVYTETSDEELNFDLETIKQLTNDVNKPFKCTECDKTFKSQGSLGNHIYSHSRGLETSSIQSKIARYSSEVSSEDLPLKPKRIKIDSINLYQCLICKQVLKSKQSLQRHTVAHSSDYS